MQSEGRADDSKQLLLRLFDVAVREAQPARMLSTLELDLDRQRTFVIAVGKAAVGMAQAALDLFHLERGLVIAPARVAVGRLGDYRCFGAGHPEPDENSIDAGEAALRAASALGEGDTLLMMISGGASALMEATPPSIPLADLQTLNRTLLLSGAPIGSVNAVRRRVSRIKGGRLAAAAWPARTLTLALSDIPGDRLADIGSGPTVAADDPERLAEEVLGAFHLTPPESIATWLRDRQSHPPASRATALTRTQALLIGSPRASLQAAERAARAAGFEVVMLGDALQGDARELGEAHAALALAAAERNTATAILSGGETTVRVTARGRGGRNKTYLAAAAARCAGHPQIWGLAADTDGRDGTEDDAGAWFGPHTLADAALEGWTAARALELAETYGLFEAAGALIDTGPTGTNVNDLRVLLVNPRSERRS